MTEIPPQLRPWHQQTRFWIGLGLAACLAVLAMPYVQRTWHVWNVKRHIRMAEEAVARGDLKQAMLDGRVALAFDAKNVAALRVMARMAEAGNSPVAIEYRRQLDAVQPHDAENLIEMAADQLKAGDMTAAEGALVGLAPADRAGARYHYVMAAIELQKNNTAEVDKHLAEACRLDPTNEDYRLRLAALRLQSHDPAIRDAAVAQVREMSVAKTSHRLSALRLLLEYAKETGASAEAFELAEKLANDPQATFRDRLIRLGTLHDVKRSEYGSFSELEARQQFYTLLSQMQVAAINQPGDLFELITWMNEHSLSLAVTEWADRIPADAAGRFPVCVGLADAYARSSAWAALRARVEKATWPQADFLRFAYLSRALERLNDPAGAQQAWSKAVAGAQISTAALETLAKDVGFWNWSQHEEEMLSKLADRPDCPHWALDKLWNISLAKGETALLFKVAKLNLQSDPKNVGARARFISLCLLTGQEAKTTPAMAEALAQENADDLSVVSLHAFSLYQQGRVKEAVDLIEKFPVASRRDPRIALYYGTFLAAAGNAQEGEEYLALGATAPQLPEEKALWEYLRPASRAYALQQKGDQAGAEQAWADALAATRSHPEDMEVLAGLAHKWAWQPRRDQALLALSTKGNCPAWATDLLWPAALATGDSNQIYNAARLLHQQDAKNASAGVNFAFASLLTRREADEPRRLAETLHQQNPADPAAAAAVGLAQFLDGKPEDAVALMRKVPPAQLATAPAPFYYGLFLAAAGQGDKVPTAWPGDTGALRFPEEKTLAEIVQFALRARAAQLSGDATAGDPAWTEAFTRAKKRPDWLEFLGRMAMNWNWTERAEQALWPLAGSDKCPRWAIDYLSGAAEKQSDSGKLYQVSKLQVAADPKNLPARNRFIYLSLLTGHDADSPDRLAEAIHHEYPTDPEATTSYAFSLYRRGKVLDALTAMARLKPEQLKEPKTALYYGIFLTAAGQNAKGEEFLQTGAEAARLPEEKTLLTAVRTSPHLGASR